MRTRFRTLLLAGAASLAVSGAIAATTINGVPATISQLVQIVWNDQNISTSNRLPANVDGSTVTASQGTPGATAWPVADGTDGPGTNPGTGARGWLSGIYAKVSGILSTQLYQGGTPVSSSNPTFVQATNLQSGSVTAAGVNGTQAQAVQGITGGVPQNSYPGQFNTTLPTLASGASGYLAVDTNGRLIQAPGAAVTNTSIAGTNRSASLTTTASTLMAANAARRGWKIKNDCTVAVWLNFDGTAAATAGAGNIQLPAGGYMSSEPGFVETGALSAIAASGTCALTAREY